VSIQEGIDSELVTSYSGVSILLLHPVYSNIIRTLNIFRKKRLFSKRSETILKARIIKLSFITVVTREREHAAM
jgi:hypothetical protein